MGTRGLTGFVVNNQIKAGYQQFDSYPGGVGVEVLNFCRTLDKPDSLIELRKKVMALKVVPENGNPTPEQFAELKKNGFADSGVSTGSDWYAALRNTQGKPAEILRSGFVTDSASFGNDSLFCEWAYVIDTDNNMLEVYKGFQTEKPETGRWKDAEPSESFGDRKYYGVALVALYRLSALPTDEEFLKLDYDDEKEDYGATPLSVEAVEKITQQAIEA
jgi:hypothetical protein